MLNVEKSGFFWHSNFNLEINFSHFEAPKTAFWLFKQIWILNFWELLTFSSLKFPKKLKLKSSKSVKIHSQNSQLGCSRLYFVKKKVFPFCLPNEVLLYQWWAWEVSIICRAPWQKLGWELEQALDDQKWPLASCYYQQLTFDLVCTKLANSGF